MDTKLKPHSQNYSQYKTDKKIMSPAVVVGGFSLDKDRKFIPNRTNLKYVKVPDEKQLSKKPLDLNEGYEIVQKKTQSVEDEKMDHILKFILQNLYLLKPNHKTMKPDIHFVCYRGFLRLIMNAPYEKKNDWSCLATKYKGVIYLLALQTEKRIRQEAKMTEDAIKACSYGFKLEQYLMTDDPKEDPFTDVPVNEAEEFNLAFKRNIGSNRMLYCAEMDGFLSDEKIDLENADLQNLQYVELKCKLEATQHWQKDLFERHTSRRWWCQCMLANIDKMFIATRTQGGLVHKIDQYNVNELPHIGGRFWTTTVCMTFCKDFLNFVYEEMKGIDCPHTVFQLDFDPHANGDMFNENSKVKMHKYIGKNPLSFLPEWYISQISEKSSKYN